MAVISLVSPKGGAGKTTLALLLACCFTEKGHKVCVIDADVNAHIANFWAGKRETPAPFTIKRLGLKDAQGRIIDLNRLIIEADQTHDIVIVDNEGTGNLDAAKAAGLSNLVITPLKATALDAAEAANAINAVADVAERLKRHIPHYLLFSNMSAMISSRVHKSLKAQLLGAKIDVVPEQLVNREAYNIMFMKGRTLAELTIKDVSGLEAARNNADVIATGILDILSGDNADEIAETLIKSVQAGKGA